MRTSIAWRMLLVIALVLTLGLTSVAAVAAADPIPAPAPLEDLKPGDIIFMRNVSDPWSSSSYWTHNGMYVGAHGSYQHAIVEATSKGVVVNNLEDTGHWYYRTDYGRAVKRLKDFNQGYADAAAEYAKSKIGTPYDYFFNKKNDNYLYCSELIWWGYLKSGVDLETNKRTSIIYPDEEYKSTYLTQVGSELLISSPTKRGKK